MDSRLKLYYRHDLLLPRFVCCIVLKFSFWNSKFQLSYGRVVTKFKLPLRIDEILLRYHRIYWFTILLIPCQELGHVEILVSLNYPKYNVDLELIHLKVISIANLCWALMTVDFFFHKFLTSKRSLHQIHPRF